MDKDTAFVQINWIFHAIENQNKLTSWRFEKLREVLSQLTEDSWERGIRVGINKSITNLKELYDNN